MIVYSSGVDDGVFLVMGFKCASVSCFLAADFIHPRNNYCQLFFVLTKKTVFAIVHGDGRDEGMHRHMQQLGRQLSNREIGEAMA
jgi:hypothetical protein